jgi:hypothetical protein
MKGHRCDWSHPPQLPRGSALSFRKCVAQILPSSNVRPNGCVHRAAVHPRLSRKHRFGGSGATFVRRRHLQATPQRDVTIGAAACIQAQHKFFTQSYSIHFSCLKAAASSQYILLSCFTAGLWCTPDRIFCHQLLAILN